MVPTGLRHGATRKPVWSRLLGSRTDHVGVQFFRYLYVGGFAAIVDTGLVYLLAYRAHVGYALAVAIAFLVGSAVNYAGCVLWIFPSRRVPHIEIPMFLAVCASGLVINELVVWALHAVAGMALLGAKVIAVAVAMMWNFLLRRLVVFR